jgi:hypothetical protein
MYSLKNNKPPKQEKGSKIAGCALTHSDVIKIRWHARTLHTHTHTHTDVTAKVECVSVISLAKMSSVRAIKRRADLEPSHFCRH